MTTEIINKLGFKFDEMLDVKGRLSITDLFPKSKARCGIYLLNFSDNTFYIGQAIDVVKRFSQHRKNHDNIIRFWFQGIKKQKLNETEIRLIYEAEISGLLLTNKTFVSNIIGETDLDQIISIEEQNEWVEKDVDNSCNEFCLFSNVEKNTY